MTEPKTYGTIKGRPVTDDVIDAWAAEAEAGYDTEVLKRRPGRPRVGAGGTERLSVRFSANTLADLRDRAAQEGLKPSAVVRGAVEVYLKGTDGRTAKRPGVPKAVRVVAVAKRSAAGTKRSSSAAGAGRFTKRGTAGRGRAVRGGPQ